MRRTLLAVSLVALSAATGLGAAPGGRVQATLTPRPGSLELGRAWQATIRLRRDGRPYGAVRPVLTARKGSVTRGARGVPTGTRGSFRVRLSFPEAGRWSYAVTLAGASLLRGALTVRSAEPPAAEVTEPFAVALAPNGRVLVADRAANRIVSIDPATRESTVVAGNGQAGFSGDGGPATAAAVDQPIGVVAAPNGDVYIATGERVRKVTAATGTISTVAGNGTRGFAGDGGPATAAALGGPGAPALDAAGNLYIPEYDNRVRRVDAATGAIRTIGGTGAEATSSDGGPAVLAPLMHPHGLDVAPDGTVYVAETWVDKIRRIDGTTGLISTIAGTGQRGFSGDGGPATSALFNVPIDIAVGPANSLYVTDGSNGRIRKIDASGGIATVAGNGSSTSSGDGGRATSAGLALPNSVAVAPDGTFYVAEFEGRRVRRVDGATGIITTIAS